MTMLVSLAEAKQHVTVMDPAKDDDIESKIQQASAIVMWHMKLATVPDAWLTSDSPPALVVPDDIKAYTLEIMGELFHNREASAVDLEPVLKLIPRDPTMA